MSLQNARAVLMALTARWQGTRHAIYECMIIFLSVRPLECDTGLEDLKSAFQSVLSEV
jgi:hypothetical protein